MGKCKTKTIQKNLGTFRHNQTCPRIIQSYSGMFRTLCYSNCGTSRTLTYSEAEAYSEPGHIHNSGIIRTQLYAEPLDIQNLRHIQNPVTHLR